MGVYKLVILLLAMHLWNWTMMVLYQFIYKALLIPWHFRTWKTWAVNYCTQCKVCVVTAGLKCQPKTQHQTQVQHRTHLLMITIIIIKDIAPVKSFILWETWCTLTSEMNIWTARTTYDGNNMHENRKSIS